MFQTRVEIPPADIRITYQDTIMTFGSCFAENIGKRLQTLLFDTDVNPFGVLYNPVSIRNSLNLLINNCTFSEADVFEHHGLWNSFSHSSLFSTPSKEQCLENINNRLESGVASLNRSNYLLITFGTAWVYEDRQGGSVVSNCHKLPARDFIRRRLSVAEIVADYTELLIRMKSIYPALRIIFSVSPIRHWKDGAHENNISKSTLLLAVEALQQQFELVAYFPAYEIQMDELRDYRFYASDMLHPSEVAVDYIWQRFSETYFDDVTFGIKREIEQWRSDLNHRPLFPDSEEYRKFQLHINKKQQELQEKYPFLTGRMF